MEELLEALVDPLFGLWSTLAIDSLARSPHMLAGVIEVHDLDRCIAEGSDMVPDPLGPITQDDHLLRLIQTSANSFDIDVASEDLGLLKADDIGDVGRLDFI